MIELLPMTEAQFARYLEHAVEDYAQAHLKAGDCDADEALTLAQADYASLLPLGLETPNQHLLSIHLDPSLAPIGMIWYEAREKRGRKSAYIYDFNIDTASRGKGYGEAVLRKLERMLLEQGVRRINLNVMGWNRSARSLYEKVGFGIAGIGMTKVLGSRP